MNQHPIPQNIMDVEFKLIGDLTIRQFAYAAIGFGLAYIAFASPLIVYVKWPLTVFTALIGLFFAFFPIDDRGADIWLLNYVKAIYHPQRRLWQKQGHLPEALTMDLSERRRVKKGERREEGEDNRLTTFLARQPKIRDNVAEVKETILLNNILSLMKEEGRTRLGPTLLPNPVMTIQAIPSLSQKVVEKAPMNLASRINYSQPSIPIKATGKDLYFRTPISNVTPNRPHTLPITPPTTTFLKSSGPRVLTLPSQPSSQQRPWLAPEHPEEAKMRNERLLTEVKTILQTLKEYNAAGEKPIIDPTLFPKAPTTQKIVTEPVAATVKPVNIDSPPAKATITQLKQIRTTPAPNVAQQPTLKVPAPPVVVSPEERQALHIETIQKQNQQIMSHLQQAQETLKQLTSQPTATLTPPLPSIPTPATGMKTAVITPSLTKEDLTQKLQEEKQQATNQVRVVEKQQFKETPLTTLTNVINGVVLGKSGERIGDAIVLIIDEGNIPKWASKTNKAGQFVMSSPVANGRYRIEVQKPGFTFSNLEMVASGSVINPITIQAT